MNAKYCNVGEIVVIRSSAKNDYQRKMFAFTIRVYIPDLSLTGLDAGKSWQHINYKDCADKFGQFFLGVLFLEESTQSNGHCQQQDG